MVQLLPPSEVFQAIRCELYPVGLLVLAAYGPQLAHERAAWHHYPFYEREFAQKALEIAFGERLR